MDIAVDVGPNTTSMLERLAQHIGIAADKAYPWYVQQASIEGWTALVAVAAIFLLSGSIFIFTITKANFDGEENHYSVIAIISGLVFMFSMVVAVFEGTEAVRKIMNPNYYAVKMLTRDIGRLAGKS